MNTPTPRIFFPMADVSGMRSAYEITLGERGEPLDRAALGIGALPTLWRTLRPGQPCPLAPEGDAVVHGVDLDPEVSMRRMGRSGQLAISLLLSGVTSNWVGVDSVWATGSIGEGGVLDTALNGVDGKLERFLDWVDAQPEGGRHLFLVPLGRYDVVEANARASAVMTHVFDPDAPLDPEEMAAGVHLVFVPETPGTLQALLASAPPETVLPATTDEEDEPVTAPAKDSRVVVVAAALIVLAILGAAFASGGGGSVASDEPAGETSSPVVDVMTPRPDASVEDPAAEPAFDVTRMGEAVDDLRRQREGGMLERDDRIHAIVAPDAGAKEASP